MLCCQQLVLLHAKWIMYIGRNASWSDSLLIQCIHNLLYQKNGLFLRWTFTDQYLLSVIQCHTVSIILYDSTEECFPSQRSLSCWRSQMGLPHWRLSTSRGAPRVDIGPCTNFRCSLLEYTLMHKSFCHRPPGLTQTECSPSTSGSTASSWSWFPAWCLVLSPPC